MNEPDGDRLQQTPFGDVIRRQRMVRPPYADEPVPRELVEQVVANARKAPSAGFSQGFAFVVLEGEQTERLWDICFATFVSAEDRPLLRSPVVVLPLEHKQAYLDRYRQADKSQWGLGESEAAWPVPYWTVDTAFATMLVLLSATAAGLGAWFFGIFEGERKLLDHLGVPHGWRPIGAIAMGWPRDTPRSSPSLARRRKPLDELVRWGRW